MEIAGFDPSVSRNPFVHADVTDSFRAASFRMYGESLIGPGASVQVGVDLITRAPQLHIFDRSFADFSYHSGMTEKHLATLSDDNSLTVSNNAILLSHLLCANIRNDTTGQPRAVDVRFREGAGSFARNLDIPTDTDLADLYCELMFGRAAVGVGISPTIQPTPLEQRVEMRKVFRETAELQEQTGETTGLSEAILESFVNNHSLYPRHRLSVITDKEPTRVAETLGLRNSVIEVPNTTGAALFDIMHYGKVDDRADKNRSYVIKSRVLTPTSAEAECRDRLVQATEVEVTDTHGTRIIRSVGKPFTESEASLITAWGAAVNMHALSMYGETSARPYVVEPVAQPAVAIIGRLLVVR